MSVPTITRYHRQLFGLAVVASVALFVASWAFLAWHPATSAAAAFIGVAALAAIRRLHLRRRAFSPIVDRGRLVDRPQIRWWRALTPWWAVALSPLLIIPVGLAAQAHADTSQDVAYLTTLDVFGVRYSNEPAAIALGHSVCDGLSVGITPNRIDLLIADGGGYSMGDARAIVGASIGAYCAQYMPPSNTPAPAPAVGATGGMHV